MDTDKKKKNIIQWFYPLFLGLVIFNVLRAVTDFTKRDTFWTGDMRLHFISLFVIILYCYWCDFLWKRELKKLCHVSGIIRPVVKEYIGKFLALFIPFNLIIVVGETIGIFYMGDGIVDYMLVNVVMIPFLLLYYTLLRNSFMNKYYVEQTLQLEKLKSKQLETELDYLKAQYHPHFLFNALNTIYFQIEDENIQAKQNIELLSKLLRYQLYAVKNIVTIGQEIAFIYNYVHFQQLRMSERLQVDCVIDPLLKEQAIHPLLFQPLLENAFKYVDGEYHIQIRLQQVDKGIRFTVENTLGDMEQVVSLNGNSNRGIGIENLKRRLALLYPGQYTFTAEKEEKLYRACLFINLKGNEN